MNCADFEKFVSAFVDGELDAPTAHDFERHAEACATCRIVLDDERRVKAAVRAGLRSVTAPADLRDRIRASLAKIEPYPSEAEDRPSMLRRSGWFATVAAAAVVLFFWYGPERFGLPDLAEGSVQQAGVFDHVADLHAKNLPVEVASANPDHVAGWFHGKVDFRVRPPSFSRQRMVLVGARLWNVDNREAALLTYEGNGRRVTVLVALPREAASRDGARSPQRRILHAHGYTGTVMQRNGLGYYLVSDLDRSETEQLVSQVRW